LAASIDAFRRRRELAGRSREKNEFGARRGPARALARHQWGSVTSGAPCSRWRKPTSFLATLEPLADAAKSAELGVTRVASPAELAKLSDILTVHLDLTERTAASSTRRCCHSCDPARFFVTPRATGSSTTMRCWS